MDARINIITLGVQDLAKSKKFYEDLGWKAASISNEHFVAFELKGILLFLYPEKLLAEDATVEFSQPKFRGIALAYNQPSKAAVDLALKEAAQAGAKIIKPAQDVFWGGYSGYFADPSGHLWEVAWNPHWRLREDGTLELPATQTSDNQ